MPERVIFLNLQFLEAEKAFSKKNEELDVRGIYLSNFYYWDALVHAKLIREKFDFGLHLGPRERSFILHGKTDDHANDVHDGFVATIGNPS